MNYEEYYEQEPSEIDEIVEDTVNRITSIIKERAKDEIESSLKAAENRQQEIAQLKKTIQKNNEDEKKLFDEISSLKADLEAKRTAIPTLPFEIGQEVWTIGYLETKKLKCPRCKGTGCIKVAVNGEDLTAECPVCHRNNCLKDKPKQAIEYCTYSVDPSTSISIIKINIDAKGTTYEYYTASGHSNHGVFATRESCREACERLNKLSLETAQKELEGK